MVLRNLAVVLLAASTVLLGTAAPMQAGDGSGVEGAFRRHAGGGYFHDGFRHRQQRLKTFDPAPSMIESRRIGNPQQESGAGDVYMGPILVEVTGDGRVFDGHSPQPQPATLAPMAKIIDVGKTRGCRTEAGVCVIRP